VTPGVPAERHFTTSAFTALFRIRQYVGAYGVEPVDAASSLSVIDAGFAASDIEAGLSLHSLLPEPLAGESAGIAYRQVLDFLVEHHRPWWRSLFPSGREHVRTNLAEAEHQLLSDAGLFKRPASQDVMAWWYAIQARVRAEQNLRLSVQGGEAELWTLEFERKKLAGLGIELEPELTGFETNGAGYDIKSYDPGPFGPVARLIEVKSTRSKPPRLILTRGEWDAALQYGDAFEFHLWEIETKSLRIIPSAEMATHMPQDCGGGRWLQVEVIP
jgi:hypothetical protein